ncbi:MAG: glycine betaine ABC transporter substrate-binding protein, partial [Pseudomonadales bacterium]
GTLICYEALVNGEIDVYVEYSGTLLQAILKMDHLPVGKHLNDVLQPLHIESLAHLGFNNTYTLAMKHQLAQTRNINSVDDLKDHPDLTVALSHEFLNRGDGWPGLKQKYALPFTPTGIEHGLAYKAIDQQQIDITDAYSTDGDLERYALTTLADPHAYFPEYLAMPLVRSDSNGEAKQILGLLANSLDDGAMRQLNAEVLVQGKSFSTVASEFLHRSKLVDELDASDNSQQMWARLLRNTTRHLKLTGIALLLACVIGVPAALLAYRSERISGAVLYVAALLQTIPSIALLALMIPLFGIGQVPAIIALFLYSLLPILRNTITALKTIDPLLRRVAEGMGFTTAQQIRYFFVPMALPNILGGIRIAAVISIGTATLAAFIGAGGLGEPIMTGLSLNDSHLILQGAIPAAVLAIFTELLFEWLERLWVPEHMRSAQLSS